MTMTGPGDRTEGVALWERWRNGAQTASDDAAPDPMELAAWADGRLDEVRAEPIEAWLAVHPEALGDAFAAQQAAAAPPPPALASDELIGRAAALVPALPENVVRLRPADVRAPLWLSAARWGGLAASLVVTSLVGFALGNDAYFNLTGDQPSVESALHELLDPPLTIFGDDEDQAT
jgi:hypothetical protein